VAPLEERIVLFDGRCNFCNGAVNFIIRHDDAREFKFAALQSDAGMTLKKQYGIGDDIDSLVLIEDGQVFLHSSAGLRNARALGFPWSIGYAFIIVPESIRDWFYKLFARYRYRLFGKTDVCMVPTSEVRERFLA
jgi:predicted DCC family thiol-disulfide oxidoreductase YuxK